MKQHPVPQHIASYQFRLIGEMTLKQFLQLAGGVVIGIIIYSLDFPGIFKWPLVLLSSFTGIALAFLPIEERSLDRWIVNFFKSIYSPSQYIWKKKPAIPDILLKKPVVLSKPVSKKPISKDKTKLKEYLESLPPSPHVSALEKRELGHLKRISDLLGVAEEKPLPLSVQPEVLFPFPETEISGVKIRKLGPKRAVFTPPAKVVKIEKKEHPLPKVATKPVVEPAPPLAPPILLDSRFPYKLDPAVAAQFSTTLPIPNTPDTPNAVVGMVLNDMGKIVPNTLIEIIDSQGETVRAFKSNKLGQFFCVSPLKKGKYQLKIEHPDFEFDIMEFKAEDKVILPIKIKAKKRKED